MYAFTLAEVLITLGIIGIVAAMTMPALVAKWQAKAIDSQFKRVYSNFYNALTMIKANNGEIPQCYYTQNNSNGGSDLSQVAECVQFYKELSEQMKVLKICEGNAYSKGCIPKYQGVDTIKRYEGTSTIIGCSGFTQSNILNKNYAYVFNDGAIMFLYDKLPGWGSVLAVDVNGKKGPNKWGHDVFAFGWKERNHAVFLEVGGCELQEEGGRHSEDILLNAARK